MKLKQRLTNLLHYNKTFVTTIYVLIVINIVGLILESFEVVRASYSLHLKTLEIFSIIIFTLEYLARVYVSKSKGQSRRKFIFSFYGIIDLLAILPFYIPFVFKVDLRVLRILRLFRFVRVFKLGRINNSFKTIKEVFQSTKDDLITTTFIAFVLLLISSTLMYYAESEAQPKQFKSILHSLWWAVATLTTVGYGDIYPITGIGKILSSIIAIIGIGFVALPTGILSSAFIDKMRNRDKVTCQQCGEIIIK
jgi:voltage-gated potassium channel